MSNWRFLAKQLLIENGFISTSFQNFDKMIEGIHKRYKSAKIENMGVGEVFVNGRLSGWALLLASRESWIQFNPKFMLKVMGS